MSAKEKKKHAEQQAEIEAELNLQSEEPAGSEAENELRSTIDRLQRLQAEFENYKKRAIRDAAAYEQRISDRLILEVLPLYDNLQRAFQSLSSNQDVETFVAGIEQIFAQFQQLMDAKGVTPIAAVNQPFDPALHEAMLCVPSDVEKNVIIEEFMPGYLRDERVLRPSRVSVSQGPPLSKEDTE
ncbi:nucleotide exchange factor GrpE [Candidatus Bipolaricaulota bacterium]